MEIFALALALTLALQKITLALRILYWKIVHLCSFFCLVTLSTTNNYFSTIFHSSILRRPLLFLKKTVRVFRSTRPLVFRKNSCSKIFGNFPVKHRWWISSILHLQTFLGYSVMNILAPISVKRNSTAYVIWRIFRSFKKM